MKNLKLQSLIGLLLAIFVATNTMAAKNTVNTDVKSFSNDAEKKSYVIGLDIGRGIQNLGIALDLNWFVEGILNGASKSKKYRLTEKEIGDFHRQVQEDIMKARRDKQEALKFKNKKAADKFLSDNKTKPGVKTTKSGLQYKVIQKGKGKKPTVTDIVEVEYTGKLIDGTVFDSSEKGGKPLSIGVQDVIPGWTEALQMMSLGAKWQVFIPSKLAYGEAAQGGPIGPNQVLIFDIHLKGIKAKAADNGNKKNSKIKKQ